MANRRLAISCGGDYYYFNICLLTAFSGIIFKNKEREGSPFNFFSGDLRSIGKILAIFNIFFLAGIFAGMHYKNYGYFNTSKSFIWQNSRIQPVTTEEAIHWIVIAEILRDKCYKENEIRTLYERHMLEYNSEPNVQACKDYIKMLTQAPDVSGRAQRGPASTE